MIRAASRIPNRFLFLIPISLLAVLAYLSNSLKGLASPSKLSLGITIDLVITIPLIYYLLIRTSKIPKTSVIPIFILGIVLGSLLLPKEHQTHLHLVKIWVLPFVEMSILLFTIYKVRKATEIALKNKDRTLDFFGRLKAVSFEILPRKVAILFATEIAVFYYGLFKWKTPRLLKNQFTYHKESGTPTLLYALLAVIFIEPVVFHLLLRNWNETVAWIFTILSIYSGFQILGFTKSLSQCPITVFEDKLLLPYGILAEAKIDLENIEHIDQLAWNSTLTENTVRLSPLGALDSCNLVIHLKNPKTLSGFYGKRKDFSSLAIQVDEKSKFLEAVFKNQEN